MAIEKTLRSGAAGAGMALAVLLSAAWASSAVAAPTVLQVSGSLNDKATITITGAGFGSKSTAAPAVWDTGQNGAASSNYDLTVPNQASNSNYNLQYRPVGYRSVPGPHSHATKYIVGGHTDTWAAYSGGAVMFTKAKSTHAEGDTLYARTYYRLDPAWQFPGNATDNNHKWWITNFGGNGPYEDNEFYIDYDQGKFMNGTTPVQHKYSPAPGHPLLATDLNGNGNWGGTSANPVSGWTLYEVEIRFSAGSGGYMRVWADGQQMLGYVGPTTNMVGSSISVGFGGYSGSYTIAPTNNFRYFADVYIDWTAQRVVLANNSNLSNATVIEPQIPTQWSDGSINATVNLGKFAAGQPAYLFVVNQQGSRNLTGLPVKIGTSGGGTPPPAQAVPNPPSSLTVN